MVENKYRDFVLTDPVVMAEGVVTDKAVFCNLARRRIIYQTRDENRKWCREHLGDEHGEVTASYAIKVNKVKKDSSLKNFVHSLRIVVNKGIFEDRSKELGEDCLVLIPYEVEHEIFESWLLAKNGVGNNLSIDKRHQLARRRQFLLAAKDGWEDRMFEFQMSINPFAEAEYNDALKYAQRRLLTPVLHPDVKKSS